MAQPAFFDQYPDFDYDHVSPIEEEFERLADMQGWTKGSREWEIKRNECLLAEFTLQFGSIVINGELQAWQDLCQELGIRGNLPSKTKCKKALRKVHVNLLDLIDDRRAHRTPHLFPSARALADYTNEHKRFFPLDEAKEDSLKKILLRPIRRRRGPRQF